MIELLIIFVAKIVEVSLTTIRMVFISRGEKYYASMIGFVEIVIWLKVASVVLVGINDYPARMVVYALGFAIGNYIGLVIEEKIGLGYSNVQIITNIKDGAKLSNALRVLGMAATVIDGKGKDDDRVIVSTYVKRKSKETVVNLVQELEVNGVVTVSETQKIYGGFGLR